MTNYHVCEVCEVKHYDNCKKCFGFGVGLVLGDPITAEQAKDVRDNKYWMTWVHCPVCGSGIWGIKENEVMNGN